MERIEGFEPSLHGLEDRRLTSSLSALFGTRSWYRTNHLTLIRGALYHLSYPGAPLAGVEPANGRVEASCLSPLGDKGIYGGNGWSRTNDLLGFTQTLFRPELHYLNLVPNPRIERDSAGYKSAASPAMLIGLAPLERLELPTTLLRRQMLFQLSYKGINLG